MITDHDTGDEDDRESLVAALRHAAAVCRALPIDPEAERMVDAAIASQPVATSKRLLRPRR